MEYAFESAPPKSSGKRRRELSFGGDSDSGGVGDKKAQTPVPTEVKNGLAFFPGAVSVQRFSEAERRHIETGMVWQRAYDSVDIISNGKPVNGGVDLAKAPVLAGVIDRMTNLIGVRPDCVHLTTREGGQIHTSHSDKMQFDVRGTVHIGADVLLGGQVDPAKSTGDFVLSNGSLSQPLVMKMRSGDAYIATPKVLHAPFLHGISPPDQASLSVVCTWSPGRGVYNLFRNKTRPLAESFPSLCGVKAVDGEDAFQVTTTERVPPRRINARIRQSGDFTDGASLFRAPPQEQASAYHRLGKGRSSNGGAASSGTDCNQVGAGPNENRAAKKRKNIPVDAGGDDGAEETSRISASKPLKELGLCLGLSADGVGLVAKLQTCIDLATGAILADPALWCDNPKFVDAKLGPRGFTLRNSTWQEDEDGFLVLGYHNTNDRNGKTPRCYASTIPVVEVGKEWLVPKWALVYIRAGKVVQRNTNNTRHDGHVEKARVKTNARKK
eukprot:g5215.t1